MCSTAAARFTDTHCAMEQILNRICDCQNISSRQVWTGQHSLLQLASSLYSIAAISLSRPVSQSVWGRPLIEGTTESFPNLKQQQLTKKPSIWKSCPLLVFLVGRWHEGSLLLVCWQKALLRCTWHSSRSRHGNGQSEGRRAKWTCCSKAKDSFHFGSHAPRYDKVWLRLDFVSLTLWPGLCALAFRATSIAVDDWQGWLRERDRSLRSLSCCCVGKVGLGEETAYWGGWLWSCREEDGNI